MVDGTGNLLIQQQASTRFWGGDELSLVMVVMVMVTFVTASVFELMLDRVPLSCNQTVSGIVRLSALVTNGR